MHSFYHHCMGVTQRHSPSKLYSLKWSRTACFSGHNYIRRLEAHDVLRWLLPYPSKISLCVFCAFGERQFFWPVKAEAQRKRQKSSPSDSEKVLRKVPTFKSTLWHGSWFVFLLFLHLEWPPAFTLAYPFGNCHRFHFTSRQQGIGAHVRGAITVFGM